MMNIDIRCTVRVTLILLVLAAVLAGCGSPTKELEQIPEQAAVVVTGVKAALVAEPQVDAAAIKVNIIDGQLVLEGFVDSAEESQRTVDIANENAEGLDVVDRLEVR